MKNSKHQFAHNAAHNGYEAADQKWSIQFRPDIGKQVLREVT